MQQLLSTVEWFDDEEQRSGVETDRWRLPKLKIDTSDVMRSIDDEEGEGNEEEEELVAAVAAEEDDAEVLLLLALLLLLLFMLISNGVIACDV